MNKNKEVLKQYVQQKADSEESKKIILVNYLKDKLKAYLETIPDDIPRKCETINKGMDLIYKMMASADVRAELGIDQFFNSIELFKKITNIWWVPRPDGINGFVIPEGHSLLLRHKTIRKILLERSVEAIWSQFQSPEGEYVRNLEEIFQQGYQQEQLKIRSEKYPHTMKKPFKTYSIKSLKGKLEILAEVGYFEINGRFLFEVRIEIGDDGYIYLKSPGNYDSFEEAKEESEVFLSGLVPHITDTQEFIKKYIKMMNRPQFN